MKIDAEIYGMIPNAKIEAWEKAPPANVSIRPRIPLLDVLDILRDKASGSIPGKTICVPTR